MLDPRYSIGELLVHVCLRCGTMVPIDPYADPPDRYQVIHDAWHLAQDRQVAGSGVMTPLEPDGGRRAD